MKEKIYQYETIMHDDYSGILLERMAEYMKIDFNDDEYEKAIDCEDFYNPQNVCIFRDKNNKDRFVMFDTRGPDYIHMVLVRCTYEEHDRVKRKFVSITNEMREDAGQHLIDDLENSIDDSDNVYNEALERFNLNYL